MQRLIVAVLALVTLSGCVQEPAADGDAVVRFETTMGDFEVKTFPEVAPITSQNFVQYVADGFYDGLTFHRIAPGFVVQGGGYLPDHQTLRDTRDPIVNEASADNPNLQWTLSMARTSAPNSATSQFFINLEDNPNLDPAGSSAGYAVFGEVISGFDVIEAMTEVTPGESFGAGGFFPAEPIIINKAVIVSGAVPTPSPAPAPKTPAELRADAITPGTWHVTHTSESIMVWVENNGEEDGNVTWAVSDLPEGWNATFEDDAAIVPGDGVTHTMLHLTLPEDAAGEHVIQLETGGSTTAITVTVAIDGERLGRLGDSVVVAYAGRCQDGTPFDSGDFPLELGSPRAIPGFSFGIIGQALDEQQTITIPWGMAYKGSSRDPCGGPLDFDVTITEFQ